MYENITYELILQRMLDRIPDTVDKREGSIIFDALAPAAVELQNMYIQLDTILSETFADTATRPYLVMRCAERGIFPYMATKAVLKAVSIPISIDVPVGARFNLGELNYIVTSRISGGNYTVECETAGVIGNAYTGELIPIDYIEGLETISITELLIPGEDEEGTEDLRARYKSSFKSKAFGGNVTDYIEKVNALNGVGGVKVSPVWNGPGTVKLTIVNSAYAKPTPTLIGNLQTAIDPAQNQGKGVGIAPIGHTVTVEACGETKVNINTHITYQEGWSWVEVKPYVEKAMEDYFKSLAKDWANQENLVVRISQIEIRLLNLDGIIDIANTSINGAQQNLIIAKENIPIRGVIVDG